VSFVALFVVVLHLRASGVLPVAQGENAVTVVGFVGGVDGELVRVRLGGGRGLGLGLSGYTHVSV